MIYTILVVDDEAPAREKVAQFIALMDDEFSATYAKNAKEGIQVLKNHQIDLLILDIQMPQMGGFEMLKTIGLDNCPSIIFSTAYDQFALQAFEVHAIDYLLKPYDFERFQVAVKKAINRKKTPELVLKTMLESLKNNFPNNQTKILWVNQNSNLIPLQVEKIEYLESDGNYVYVHTNDHKYLIRQSLHDLHQKLSNEHFIRVHRSFVINQLKIKSIYPKSHGDMFAVLESGNKIPVSRKYKSDLIA